MSFQGYLKADTQVYAIIGPAVAVGDGFTPVTNLTLSSADEAEIIKHNTGSVTSISGGTMSAISSADGYYKLTMLTGYLNTEGMLTVLINDDSKCLPLRSDFMVVNANVYNSLFAAAGTDYLTVDMIQLGGATQSATDLKDFADAGYDPATNITNVTPSGANSSLVFYPNGYIVIYFTNAGSPATGLTVTLDVYNVVTAQKALNGVSASEIGGGFYYYNFSNFDNDKIYAAVADGSATLGNYDRYPVGYSGSIGSINKTKIGLDNMYFNIRDLKTK